MEQEVKEETKEPQGTESPAEASEAPTDEQQQQPDSSSSPPAGEQLQGEKPIEEAPSPEPEEPSVEELKAQLAEATRLKEEYKNDLLAIKRSSRRKSLEFEEIPDTEQSGTSEVSDIDSSGNSEILRDYRSKRADVLAEFEQEFAGLSDEEFRNLKENLEIQDKLLTRNATTKGHYVARKHIENRLKDALSYVKFRHRKEEPSPSAPLGDIGPTKGIRKIASGPRISDEAREIQRHTIDPKTGKPLPLERIQEMIDKGQV